MSGARAYVASGVAAAVLAAGWAVGAVAAGAVPNPCTIVSVSAVSSAAGLKGVVLHGSRSTRPDGAVKQSICTFKHGPATLEIYIAPHQPSGGSGGPPGMVLTRPAGLGSGASFAYDLNPKFQFANVSFTKSGFDAGVWDNGKYPSGDVLALARLVYKALG